jgi:hypothetical protein
MARKTTTLRAQAQKDLVDKLVKIGKDVMEKAFKSADFKKDKTQNLHDSYGCAVYHNGLLVKDTIQTLTEHPKATQPRRLEGEDVYGREHIEDYLRSYKPRSRGFQLVVIASMPYAGILEAGKSPLNRKYTVISGIKDELKTEAKNLGGTRSRRLEGKYVIRHIKDAK